MTLSESFTLELMNWWQLNKRSLPWKDTKDPYKIWLSEIILQQTTIRQGTPYYLKFIENYPTIGDLARAEIEEVFKMWEGLGYYNRAKNMHSTARYIYTELNSRFPEDYHELLKLNGVGPYTGAAIASFAFEKQFPVIDGNVIRLVSRWLGLKTPTNSPQLISEIHNFLRDAIQYALPSEFNQALMDFGSVICSPRKPECSSCPLSAHCNSFLNDWVESIPVKPVRKSRKIIFFHFIHIVVNNRFIVLQQRDKSDIWPGLFQLPYVDNENVSRENLDQLLRQICLSTLTEISMLKKMCEKKQILTHRTVHGHFSKMHLKMEDIKINNGYYLVDFSKVRKFAFPKIIREYFDNHSDLS